MDISHFYDKLTNKSIEWSHEDTEIITQIIHKINAQPLLNFPDLNKNFELYCDASESGKGAVLFQEGKLISLFSSTYKGSEKNYSIAEKEMLAILKAFQKFKHLLFNAKTTILTDNKNIVTPGCLTKRMNRWKLTLQEYDHEIKHIEGKKNIEADLLSRTRFLKINSINNEYDDRILLSLPNSLQKNFKSFCEDKTDKSS
ncbi:Retrovirus-related Pol polyprotein from transposon, partial [Dictyocoela muelleri]